MRIPKVIHRIWLGEEEMPSEYVRFGESWREHHPGWEMRLWTDAELPPLSYPDALERCRNYGEASDVVRYEILYRFGGVYVDTDVECLRPIEPLVAEASAFAAYARPNVIGSAVLGAVPGHPAIGRVLEAVCTGAGSGAQVEATGPVALTRILQHAEDVELFGSDTFYPLDYWEIPFRGEDVTDVGDAFAIHHWHATWQTRENLMQRTRALMLRMREIKERERSLKQQQGRLLRKLERRELRLQAALRRQRALDERLERVQSSRWWRLGQALARVRRTFSRSKHK